jgi:hypothetical protein
MSTRIENAVEVSASLRFLGQFSSALSSFDGIPQSSLTAAIAKSEIYHEQKDYKSAVAVLDALVPPNDQIDFDNLEYVLARMQAEATRRLSMQNNPTGAREFAEEILQGLNVVATRNTTDNAIITDSGDENNHVPDIFGRNRFKYSFQCSTEYLTA